MLKSHQNLRRVMHQQKNLKRVACLNWNSESEILAEILGYVLAPENEDEKVFWCYSRGNEKYRVPISL